MTLRSYILLLALLIPAFASAAIDKVEPPHWWVGMKNPNLQLMVYGEGITDYDVATDAQGVKVSRVSRQANRNYLYIDLIIDESAQAGNFELVFSNAKGEAISHQYLLKQRVPGSADRQGFSSKDAIYLITPDRFANGDPSNDNHRDMLEQADRTQDYGRHGGDIQGILENLDFIADLGITQIWSSPLLENNMESYSYHGYSITDLYQVDPRFGGNEAYVELSEAAREKGIGLIMDTIPNHIGSNHWWMNDLPSDDWINNIEQYQNRQYSQTTHIHETNLDPYASQQDKDDFSDGWFVKTMPDLNQRNPYLARYLIQNNIWWIEEVNLTGFRVDTYPYADKDFMVDFSKQILDEYPNLNIVGEVWRLEKSPHSMISYYQAGKLNQDGFKPSAPALMDFPLQNDALKAFTSEDPESAAMHLYLSLATDYVYADPMNLVVLPDNHDMDRIFTWINRDQSLLKTALSFFATTRGAVQIYYGTEVLLANDIRHHHGDIRRDFPGGWPGDSVNAFTKKGLSKAQEETLGFTRKLLNWRKGSSAIHSGQLRHFVPRDGVYVYFRFHEEELVMVALNFNDKKTKLKTDRFAEYLGNAKRGYDVIDEQWKDLGSSLSLKSKSATILEIR